MQGLKMKRKDLEEVNDDFSDFSLSSPARKIRRLDAELPPIMEEDESDTIPLVFEQSEHFPNDVGGPIIEGLPVNDERAIVLFKPMTTPLLQSPSGFSLSVDSDIILGFKNQFLRSNPLKVSKSGAERQDENLGETNECMAVVPWVPSYHPQAPGAEVPQTDVSELMEAEEMEPTTMDIEDASVEMEPRPGNDLGGASVGEGLHQWQQHCMVPQPPHNTSTPLVWFR